MSRRNLNAVDPETETLLALLQEKANGAHPEADQFLARHLQCKDSVRLATAIQNALDSGEDAVTFARQSILQAIGAERRALLERNVDFHLEISDVYPDGYSYSGKKQLDHRALSVSVSCGGAGVFQLGKVIAALEQEAEGLGAAWYWTLLRSLHRVMRVYDHDDALYYEEMLRESAEQEDPEYQSQVEFPEVEKALPECIRKTLGQADARKFRRLLKDNRDGPLAGWIARLRRLEQLARLGVRDDSDQIQGNFDSPPLPCLLVFFEERDAITACFDEESQSMLEGSAEPALFVIFSPDKEEDVARAMALVHRFVAFNVELFTLIEEVEEREIWMSGSRSGRTTASSCVRRC